MFVILRVDLQEACFRPRARSSAARLATLAAAPPPQFVAVSLLSVSAICCWRQHPRALPWEARPGRTPGYAPQGALMKMAQMDTDQVQRGDRLPRSQLSS